jgi:uncharacterized protein YbjT (DUF2867 family)
MRRLCVLGGTGFVGTELIARVAGRGDFTVRVLTRDAARARHLSVLPGVELIHGNAHELPVLRRAFAEVDAVINLIGILNERGFSGQGFERAHVQLTGKVLQAAAFARVRQLLHMSSLGAAEDAPSHYLRSKGRAESQIRATRDGLHWSIFRPSVIFGARDSLTRRFAALLQATGGVLPLARPDARFAPVHVGDVATAFERALTGNHASGQSYELCGPQVMTLRELVEAVARHSGRRARVIPLSDPLARVQAFVMDFVPGRPFSTDNYRSLGVDSICKDGGCARLGIQPVSLDALAPLWLGTREPNARRARWRASTGLR